MCKGLLTDAGKLDAKRSAEFEEAVEHEQEIEQSLSTEGVVWAAVGVQESGLGASVL